MQKPDCDCWRDPQQRGLREGACDSCGNAAADMVGNMLSQFSFCLPAAPYLGAACLCGIALVVASALVVQEEIDRGGDGGAAQLKPERVSEALDMMVKLAHERIAGGRAADLDRMRPANETRN